jgi:hypothetical protein
MAQPKTRKASVSKMPTEVELRPAPDNGVPYAGTPARARPPKTQLKVRDYPQLSTRVPPDLMERIQRCLNETGVSLSFLVRQGLEHEMETRGY